MVEGTPEFSPGLGAHPGTNLSPPLLVVVEAPVGADLPPKCPTTRLSRHPGQLAVVAAVSGDEVVAEAVRGPNACHGITLPRDGYAGP